MLGPPDSIRNIIVSSCDAPLTDEAVKLIETYVRDTLKILSDTLSKKTPITEEDINTVLDPQSFRRENKFSKYPQPQ